MRAVLFLLLPGWLSISQAQVINSWTNPSNARWENMYWSLGILPGPTQSVYVTNSGYKAVEIFNTTVADHASSLTISNLTVSAPESALSTVLLNYTGLSVPLRILGGCEVNTNGTLQNSYGSLQVDGAGGRAFHVIGQGQYIQEGGLTLARVPVNVFDGQIRSTNGNMTLGQVTLGDGTHWGEFLQVGGSIAADYLQINGGRYTLVHGMLYDINGASLLAGYYDQYGGTNYGDMTVNLGRCLLHGGLMHGNVLGAGPRGEIEQWGGKVEMQTVNIFGGDRHPYLFPSFPHYIMNQGQLYCGTLHIEHNGLFEQSGGLVMLTNHFDLHGASYLGTNTEYAAYRFIGGRLTAPSLSMGEFGIMNQWGGTNQLTGSGLTISNTVYHLDGGLLETTYTGVGVQAWFSQTHGVHKINGVLSVTGDYELWGGTVQASGLYLRGILTARAYYDSASFAVNGLTDLGGTVYARMTNINLGAVRLSTNAVIDFADNINGIGSVRCANSSAFAWMPGQSLVISNWDGGLNHIHFGTDSSGLTPGQLAQVSFANPVGLPGGYYPAQMLADGELVPGSRPTLQMARSGSVLVLSWVGSYQLLSATNIAGPYTPVPNASSPWTNGFTKPKEFFLLQGL